MDAEHVRLTFKIANEISDLKLFNVYNKWKIQRKIFSHYHIVRMNYFELDKCIKIYKEKTYNLNLDNQILIHRYQNILSKKYFNFISSGQSFIETNYKIDFDNLLICFFKEIRNFSMHQELLSLNSHWIPKMDGLVRVESFNQNIFKKNLINQLENKKKNFQGIENAIKFIESREEKLDLEVLCASYFEEICKIHRDILTSFLNCNKKEINYFIQENIRVKNLIKELNFPIMGLVTPLRTSEIRYLRFLLIKFL